LHSGRHADGPASWAKGGECNAARSGHGCAAGGRPPDHSFDADSGAGRAGIDHFTSSLTAAAPIETTLRGDRKTLHDAITGNTPAVIDQVSANIGVLNGQIMAIQSKADAAFYAILDSTQQTKFSKRGGPRGRGGRAH
jgi:hypothetical protein